MLVVRSAPSDQALADALAAQLPQALAREGLVVQRPAPWVQRAAPDHGDALAAARRAFQELRPEEAARALEALVRQGDQDGGLGLSAADWLDVYLLLSLARSALGDEAGADDAIARALAAAPDLAPAPERWAPPLRARVEQVRATRSVELVPVSFAAQPRDASLWIDSASRPLAESIALAPGVHRLRLEARGHATLAMRVELDATTTLRIAALELEPTHWLAHPGEPGAALDARVSSAAASLQVELVVVDLTRMADGLRTRIEVGELSAAASHRSGASPAAIAEQLATAWRQARTLDAAAELPVAEPPSEDDQLALWIGLGVGVAAAVALALGLGVGLGTQRATGFTLRGELP